MNRLMLLAMLLMSAYTAAGQMYFKEGRQICCGDSLLSGNAQALDINPSQLGRVSSKKYSLGLLQLGANVYTNRLNLSDALIFAFSDDSVSSSIKDKLISPTALDPFVFNSNFDLNWASFSFATPNLGGVAIRLKDRVSSYSLIPNELLAQLLEGQASSAYQNNTVQELAAAASGTRANYNHIRELSLGYGRALLRTKLINLYAGATLKRLWGIGYFNTTIQDGTIRGLSAFSELYDINYGDLNPEGRNYDSFKRKLLNSSGSGWGVDLGLTMDIAGKFMVGAAVMDIGSLEWNQGVVEAQASAEQLIENLKDPALQTFDFKEQLATIYEDFQFQESDGFSVPLNSQLRLNAAWLAGNRLSLNADALIPLNNDNLEVLNYGAGSYAAGVNYRILAGRLNMNLSTAFFYSSEYNVRVPLGLSFGALGGTRFSISATDILTFIDGDKDPFPGISITGLNFLF